MKIPGFRKTGGQIIKSKAMIGGCLMIGVGIYLLTQSQYTLGVGQLGIGLSIMGIPVMLSKLKLYGLAVLGFLAGLFGFLWQRAAKNRIKDKQKQTKANLDQQKALSETYAKGEKEYQDEVSKPTRRGHFTK